ncbi:uncharacterized protein LOC126784148 [Argentina anserina]|uniref:uncharacterized protein LOC126784148 n=1 Tax=Argentina anserina TaxID=57926 RepID=UPI002176637F|nr:uncharacterized protein LOC126784148 [Potentilla anserina]
MEGVKILTLFAATLLLLPNMEAQHYPPPRPLCASQFALASYACSLLPYGPMPTPQPPPPAPSPPDDDDDDDDDDGHSHGHGSGNGKGNSNSNGHGQEHHQGHGHGHKQHRRHSHRHRHRHHHREKSLSPQEDNCCKWLTQLDNQCVCELLLRLPTFLLKPAHTYSVFIGSSCNITYSCSHP